MDDIDSFNGEINNKLSGSYKIPLKGQDSAVKCIQQSNSQDPTEQTFSSPLLGWDSNSYDDSVRIPRNDEPKCVDSITQRKRKAEEKLFLGRDDAFPPELNALILPFDCNLCNAKLNSPKTAKCHYESKTHEKKVKHWLEEWGKKFGEPLPKFKKIAKEGLAGPSAYYCETCDLKLTSIQHASQHYNGKRHKMVVSNISNPSGSGYYDNEGKWVRTPVNVKTNSRYGIGDLFVKSPEQNNDVDLPKPVPKNGKKYCEICNIFATSDQQMTLHFNGSKHAKKLKAKGDPPYFSPGDTVLASIQANKKKDVSMYRTPTGNYYCEICDVTLPDSGTFIQHLDSKTHVKGLKTVSAE